MDRECDPAADEGRAEPRSKKNKMKNKRRFSDEQIRLLESIFESETNLDPRKKMQLARELGLQPRQVAIWFQNRRARWKSKRIEQDYNTLKANYDNLESRFEWLKKEKQSLILQMQKLSELLAEPRGRNRVDGSSAVEAEAQPSFGQAENNSDDVKQTGLAAEEFLMIDGLDSAAMLDHSCSTSSQWLNFWT
ncbi:Homeobox-leucine zipper protein ATHB-7 [Hibiscus syriacus]|uniref:Homeobox-leucine zipper protein n=1 Tax=Hibiscus syriacus TaxID=106335 RepID=A0A6A2ZRV2_HIBSY|nr:homeobox-leucine zipper protein ATHB-12-like [Hibiscus syriacus]KAE8694684.1 Homeobox-leucine zipper protein ATHB-7 [Hibiscus syriacus]